MGRTETKPQLTNKKCSGEHEAQDRERKSKVPTPSVRWSSVRCSRHEIYGRKCWPATP